MHDARAVQEVEPPEKLPHVTLDGELREPLTLLRQHVHVLLQVRGNVLQHHRQRSVLVARVDQPDKKLPSSALALWHAMLTHRTEVGIAGLPLRPEPVPGVLEPPKRRFSTTRGLSLCYVHLVVALSDESTVVGTHRMT